MLAGCVMAQAAVFGLSVPLQRSPIIGLNFLFAHSSSLLPNKKFPVLLHREFGCNRLNWRVDWVQKSLRGARNYRIPCKFPC
jgi:hypothetical protein